MTVNSSHTTAASGTRVLRIHLALFAVLVVGQLLSIVILGLNDFLGFIQSAGMLVGVIGGLHALWALVRNWVPSRAAWAGMLVAWIVLICLPGLLFALGMSLGGVG